MPFFAQHIFALVHRLFMKHKLEVLMR